ncbi:alpha/beta-Hydrolase [Glarea lozoyensis ATCC 20868]|nr:alpha/beta-Hydrolase [Glarea lozoyensis ATCC 20868]EPE28112.1 alpha/beta-Hydrolase [Glarea lozoyensis ATCC 20868]
MNIPEDYDPTGVQHYDIPSFLFNTGRRLPVRIAYRSFNSALRRVVCIPTPEHSHINTTYNYTLNALRDYHVIVVATLGNGESSSPSNTLDFPQPVYQDCVSASYELLTKHFNIQDLEAVVGYGMGGQQAYYWMCMRPGFVKSAVVICGSARTSPFNHMLLDGIAATMGGSAVDTMDKAGLNGTGPHGYGKVTCAWSTSSAWFKDESFRTILGHETLPEFIEEYNNAFRDWNAADLLALVRMWQLGDVGALRDDGSYLKALEDITGRVLVIASRTDSYFSPEDSAIELKHLKFGKLEILETIWGHAAGSGVCEEDMERICKMIAAFLGEK